MTLLNTSSSCNIVTQILLNTSSSSNIVTQILLNTSSSCNIVTQILLNTSSSRNIVTQKNYSEEAFLFLFIFDVLLKNYSESGLL